MLSVLMVGCSLFTTTLPLDHKQLFDAAVIGDLSGAQQTIAAGANVNEIFLQECGVSFERLTALYMAACRGDLDMVKLLVEAGADVHANDDAVKKAAYYGHWAVVACLLRHGADRAQLERWQINRLYNSAQAQQYIAEELREALNKLDISAVEKLVEIIPLNKISPDLQEQIWNFSDSKISPLEQALQIIERSPLNVQLDPIAHENNFGIATKFCQSI